MGRLWQTLILSQWKPLFENIPVESMVYANQEGYYKAIRESTQNSDSAPFIEFMLSRILEACIANNSNSTPQVTPQVSPQVQQLISVMKEIDGEANREQLQRALKLSDRKSFRSRYLLPALENGLIEMTLPDKPNSSLQKYRLTALGKKLLAKA